MRNKGWTKLYRAQFTHWISERKPWCDGYAWCYLCSRANHKKGAVNFRNQYIEIERGQLLTSKLKLQKIFGWSYRKTTNFLKALKNIERFKWRGIPFYHWLLRIANHEIANHYRENGQGIDDLQIAFVESFAESVASRGGGLR